MRLRVGVVGCGEIAQMSHLRYLDELSELFEIASVCDLSRDLVEKVGRRYRVASRYHAYQQLLEENLDAVFVLTREHTPIALAALERGLHVFVEKPLAFNAAQATTMIEAARRNRAKLMVGYQKRFNPGFQHALGIIREMEGPKLIRLHSSVGSPQMIKKQIYELIRSDDLPQDQLAESTARERQSYIDAVQSDDKRLLLAYRLLIQLWSHCINLVRGTFGEPKEIACTIIRELETSTGLPSCQIISILDYGDQTSCLWESQAFLANNVWDDELAIFANARTVRVSFPNPFLKNIPAVVWNQRSSSDGFVIETTEASYEEAFKRELVHFHACIVEGKEPLTNGEDARADLELVTRMVRKAALL
jgi:predicted dehydrogenase